MDQLTEDLCVYSHLFVRGDDDPAALEDVVDERLRFLRVGPAMVQQHAADGGVPIVELPHPLVHDGRGAHEEARSQLPAVVQASKVGHNLDSLAQAHLIPDDASRLLAVQLPQPFDSRLLVGKELAVHIPGAPDNINIVQLGT